MLSIFDSIKKHNVSKRTEIATKDEVKKANER